ncbi:MAG TPA: ACP S-malonyltransferase [Candidatus Limnocylindrales bacterium]|nr:ACP S-malonyltransferase [Candidatus Limnocylindrales bacterium]
MSLALLFSPQGSQSLGMGRDLAEQQSPARSVFEAADAALGWSVSNLAWTGPEDRLNDTHWTQPALLTASVAALAALESNVDPKPAFVAGHSVGEYAALVAAKVLAFPDALRLVAKRGELMAAANAEGGMSAVIGLDRSEVAEAIAASASPADLVIANDNAPGQVVISGTKEALLAATSVLREAGARRIIRLQVSGPFHSPWMADVTDLLAAAFGSVSWSDADPPVVSNVTAEPVTDAGRIRDLLAEQVRSPVEWVASVRRMVQDGVDTFVECGPGNALAGMVRRIAPKARTLNVADKASLAATLHALSAMPATASAKA